MHDRNWSAFQVSRSEPSEERGQGRGQSGLDSSLQRVPAKEVV